jgi:hypothetical protein
LPSFEEIGDLGWEPEVLEAKAKSIKRDAIMGIVAGIIGFFIFGILLGAYAIYSGRDALLNIKVYGVGRTYKWVALTAQVLGVLAIILSIVGIIIRFSR